MVSLFVSISMVGNAPVAHVHCVPLCITKKFSFNFFRKFEKIWVRNRVLLVVLSIGRPDVEEKTTERNIYKASVSKLNQKMVNV